MDSSFGSMAMSDRKPMKLSWLVFFSGSPSRGDWKRIDAASRIVRAALSHQSDIHLVFEDKTCISVEPEFLGVWTGTEAHYFELMESLVKGQSHQGVLLQPFNRKTLKESLSALIEQMPNIDVVLDFREDGHSVMCSFEQKEQKAPRPVTGALCVIGGVRDIHAREHDVLNSLCQQMKKPQVSVSLGAKAELTSKCIKATNVLTSSDYACTTYPYYIIFYYTNMRSYAMSELCKSCLHSACTKAVEWISTVWTRDGQSPLPNATRSWSHSGSLPLLATTTFLLLLSYLADPLPAFFCSTCLPPEDIK